MKSLLLNRVIHSCELHSNEVFLRDASTGIDYSYQQFLKDAHDVATLLNSQYTNTEVIVLLGTNSYEFVVHLMGVMFSGKTLFLINPDEDIQIIKYLLNQTSEKKLCICAREIANLEEESILFSQIKERPKKTFIAEKSIHPVKIYIPTSATTGISKIVVQKERDILENIDALINHHQLNSNRKNIGTPLPFFHVNALHFSFFCTLFTGGKLTIYSEYDLKKMIQSIAQHRLNILSVIPPILNSIIRNYEKIDKNEISDLEYFVSAAAPLLPETAKKIMELTSKKIIQGYGLSEGINFSCKMPINIDMLTYLQVMVENEFTSIGPPLQGSELKIVRDGQHCSENDEGEVLIKGANFSNGYLNNDKQDLRDNFFPSGDIGYFKILNNQKYYFITGRKKEIAKINGEGVSLRMIESLIEKTLPFPVEFIVTSFDNQFKGEELALVCSSLLKNQSEILNNLEQAINILNSNRRPKIILFTDEELRTPSGKARRWYFKKYFVDYKEIRLLNKNIKYFSSKTIS